MESLVARAVTTISRSCVLSTCYSRYGKLNQKRRRVRCSRVEGPDGPYRHSRWDGRISRGVFIDRAEAAYSDIYQATRPAPAA